MITTRTDVVNSLINDYRVWDDMAEIMCDEFESIIETNKEAAADAIAQAILDAECKKLGVEELPEEDYFVPDDEEDSDLEDEDDTEEWEDED